MEEVPVNSTGNDSEKALKVYDNAVGDRVYHQLPEAGRHGRCRDGFHVTGHARHFGPLHIKDAEGTKTPIALEVRKPQLPIQEDAYALVYKNKNGQDVKLTGLPAANRWYNLKVIANAVANTMDIYVDNVLARRVELRDDMRTLDWEAPCSAERPELAKEPTTSTTSRYTWNRRRT